MLSISIIFILKLCLKVRIGICMYAVVFLL